jgi:hypothetical protein
LNKFRFDDGTQLDYRGDAGLSLNGRDGILGNYNERAGKGFVTTFSLPRTLGDKGKFKLDWIFVKAYLKDVLSRPCELKLENTTIRNRTSCGRKS